MFTEKIYTNIVIVPIRVRILASKEHVARISGRCI